VGTAKLYDEWFDRELRVSDWELAAWLPYATLNWRVNEIVDLYPVLLVRSTIGVDAPGWWLQASNYLWSVASWNARVAGITTLPSRADLNRITLASGAEGGAKHKRELSKLKVAAHGLGSRGDWIKEREIRAAIDLTGLVTRSRYLAAGATDAEGDKIVWGKSDRSAANKAANALKRELDAYRSLAEMHESIPDNKA
jgi:hypothetical protein